MARALSCVVVIGLALAQVPPSPCPGSPANFCECGAGDHGFRWLCRANNGFAWESDEAQPECPCPCKYKKCTLSQPDLAAPALPFRMLPGQSFSRWPTNTSWTVQSFGGRCVVKSEHSTPHALIDPPNGTACPVGTAFDPAREPEALPWMPYPAGSAGREIRFNGTKRRLLDPMCSRDQQTAGRNRDLLNGQLAQMRPGDRLVVPEGVFCMAAGVVGLRLSHGVIDLQGELYFGQGHQEWTNVTNGTGYAHAILFQGLTNVTITSSTGKGKVSANGCTLWYLQREFGHVPGPPPLIEIGADPELTFASSQVVVERITVQDGPNWQTYFNKVHNVVIRHVRVEVSCSQPATTPGNMVGALALNTDGIDIWGSDIHVHDVYVRNADDCICVKGDNDGSRIWSENWLVENSTASGEGLTVGTMWSGNFITRNVTFRNIVMPDTRKGIYVKIDTPGNSAQVLYQNITLTGHTLQFPVFIGPIHQFTKNSCPWSWPWFRSGTCSVNSDASVDVQIDGLHIARAGQPNGLPLYRTSDFVIQGNQYNAVRVRMANVKVDGSSEPCNDPPLSRTGTCSNACFAADVVTDGSVKINCTQFNSSLLPAGACAPLMGSVEQRCVTGNSNSSKKCQSGLVCA